jgi:hypothetical protein
MTYAWSAVREALIPFRAHLLNTVPEIPEDGTSVKKTDPYRSPNGLEWGPDDIRLRLDYACPLDASWPEAVGGILRTIDSDLTDIIVNGDKDLTSDPMLKSFNGSKKRGKEVKSVRLDEVCCFTEKKPKLGDQEHTIYMLVHVEWED